MFCLSSKHYIKICSNILYFSGIAYKPAVSQFLLPGLKILPSNNIQTPAHWPRLYLLLSNSGLLKDILNQFCTAKPKVQLTI